MIELGKLEGAHEQFAKRNIRVVVASPEEPQDAESVVATQKDFPHLVVVADGKGNMIKSLGAVHAGHAPGGGDTAAPTTFIVDEAGKVRWIFRPDRFLTRLSPDEVLAAVNDAMRE